MKSESGAFLAKQIESGKKLFTALTAAAVCGAPYATSEFSTEKSLEGEPLLFGRAPEQLVDISKTEYIKAADSLSEADLLSLMMTRERYRQVRPHLRDFFYASSEGVDPKYAPHSHPVPVFSSFLVKTSYRLDHEPNAKHPYLSDGEVDDIFRKSLLAFGRDAQIPMNEVSGMSGVSQHYAFKYLKHRSEVGGGAGVRLIPHSNVRIGDYYMNEANVTFVNYAKDLLLSKNIEFASPEDEESWQNMPESVRIDAFKKMYARYYEIMAGHEKIHEGGMLTHKNGTLMHPKVIFAVKVEKNIVNESPQYAVNMSTNFDSFDTHISVDALKVHAYIYRKAAGEGAIADVLSK